MNQDTILPDDPRLTAYALNEMTPAERADFERLLQADPAALRAVEEIQAAGAMLASALEAEPLPQTAGVSQEAILAGGDLRRIDGGKAGMKKTPTPPIRFPQFYYVVSGLAAACFAVFFVYWQQSQPGPGVSKQYVEMDLGKTKGTEEAVSVALPNVPPPAVTMGTQLDPVPAAATPVLSSFQESMPAPAVTSDLSLAASSAVVARSTPSPSASPTTGTAAQEETVPLSPFSVKGDERGYAVATTVAGSRLSTEVRDIGSVVAVVNQQFLRDQAQAAEERSKATRAAGRPAASARMTEPMNFALPGEPAFSTEAYAHRKDSDYLRVADHPLSTFSVDVDTASYANVRRFLTQGRRPPVDAVRIEELVNYFNYSYGQPEGTVPFAAHLEVASAPWAPAHRLVRVGLKGREVSDGSRPAANLVFLLDVSGSMHSAHKLPLVKQALRLLVEKLRPDDRVAIAVYAGASGMALPSTPLGRKAEILEAIDRLEAGGSTNGAMGIHLAYDMAKANFVAGGVNRVILATDGDFNVGTTSEGELVRLVEEKAKSGVFLSVLGFGMGNLKDSTLEQIADKGNGNYAYIDTLAEARKALVEQAGGTLVTIAKDVKIQVEFNPAQVAAYRLIGYENRMLAKEDFNNDAVDAGEIGAGHTVTALYEVVPAGAETVVEAPAVDELKYQAVSGQRLAVSQDRTESRKLNAESSASGELLTVKIRYKEPAGDVSSKVEFALRDTGARFEDASQDFKFAAAVAGFGLVLRDSPHKGSLTLADVAAWGRAGLGSDAGGYRGEFLGLVDRAQALLQ